MREALSTNPAHLGMALAALWMLVFLVPPIRYTLRNYLDVAVGLAVQKKISFSGGSHSDSLTFGMKTGSKTTPPPLLANLVMLSTEYSLAAAPIASSSGEEEIEAGFYLDALPSVQGVAFFESAATTVDRPSPRSEIYTYVVEENDTLSSIAELFGVSLDTLLFANKLTARSVIRPGDIIAVLPVNGVSHAVAKGDTVSSLARKYNASADDIIAYNNLSSEEKIAEGTVLVIPDGVPPAPPQTVAVRPIRVSQQTIEAPVGWLDQPATGRNWGRRHGFNGVDIANTCGTPIISAAYGTVIVADGVGWNGGYGKYLKIQHPNGVITLYAHAQEVLVDAGQEVAQGQQIAVMGTTGRSTGCHVHFEVRGARNPFAKR